MSSIQSKIGTLDELRRELPKLKRKKKRVVLCHGVFDLLHLGHIRHLNSAKEFGDILVVTTTSDRFVKRGPGRPIFRQELRAETLANLEVVDFVAVADFPTAIESIQAVRPDFYVKGPDYADKDKDITAMIYEEESAVKSVGGKVVFTDDMTFSSSQLINLHFDSYPDETVKHLKKLSSKYTSDQISTVFEKISKLKILVIGDAIIDQYHYCTPLGKSAKEIIVANKYISEEDFAGGTLATANHVAQIAKSVNLLTVLGETETHETFIRARLGSNIKPRFIYRPGCSTVAKKRFVNSQNNQKLFEVCYLDDQFLNGKQEAGIVQYLQQNASKFDLIVVSDFGHGMMTPSIIDVLTKKAACLAINAQTNSANTGFNLVTKYPRADFVCIDQLELRLATGDKFGEPGTLLKRLQKQLKCKQIIATRGPQGSLSYSAKNGLFETPAFASKTVDLVGAGDAFYAYTAPCFAAGVEPDLLGFVGNAAGCLKVQIVGNREPVKSVDLMKFMARLLKV